MNASFDPSGDHRSASADTPLRFTISGPVPPSTHTCPLLRNAIIPVLETAGEWPDPTLRGGLPAVAIQTSCETPAGFDAGFGSAFAASSRSPPRTNTTDFPSGRNCNSPTSWPSSAVHDVSWTPLKSGAAAYQLFRAPRSFSTHATALPPGAALKSDGKGADITCSSVNVFAHSETAIAEKAKIRRRMAPV